MNNAVMSKKRVGGNFVNFSYKQKQDVFTNVSTATVSPKCKMVGTTLDTTKQAQNHLE